MVNSAQNTLELARQGDPAAIAIILTYHLSQRFNTTASAIRLGDYLSILIDASFTTPQEQLVSRVLGILSDLAIVGISVVEISARQIGDRKVQWSQTIELATSHIPIAIMTNLTNSTPAVPVPAGNHTLPEPAIAAPLTTPAETWEPSLHAFFQRPELVALIAFAVILVLWDSYLEWMGEIDATQPLTGVKLAQRLGVSASTLSRVKTRPNFREWSRDLDPDGIAWSYENKLFVPLGYSSPRGDRELVSLTH